MATYPVTIPRLGEAVIEATLTRWLKNEGDPVKEDEPIAEIATDKVDSEIIAPADGILRKKLAAEGEVVPVGNVIAELETYGEQAPETPGPAPAEPAPEKEKVAPPAPALQVQARAPSAQPEQPSGTRFYSPLVRNIAKQENIPFSELDVIPGTGKDDRLTKQDLLTYIQEKKSKSLSAAPPVRPEAPKAPGMASPQMAPAFIPGSGDTIIEMDRIRQLISGHMLRSVQTSPHVTSFAEADVTKIVQWRDRHKDTFFSRENEKLTYTPLFIEAIAKAVRDYPMVNISVDGTKIVQHHNINVGMAVALPTGNLIVPVMMHADQKNLYGLVKGVNDLANRARQNKLVPDEIMGGTISLTNLGSFDTLAGTPIINQPQCAIVAVGIIKKRPVVLETPEGDVIAIRHMMIASVTYDHRVIDGALGGKFLKRFVEYLETFDSEQSI
jgi:2-oxoglutarate dehydrogenase E2 component (dihydrolipoamide succinyltransferase)